jgi:cytoskeletal protein RodZ
LNIYLKISEDIEKDEFIKNIISARENKKVSVKDAAKYLNISQNIILKLEKGNFTEIPNDIFIIGHIRTYLKWIEINPNLLLKNTIPSNNNLTAKTPNIILPYKFKLPKFYILLFSIIAFFFILIIYKNLNKIEKVNDKIITTENIIEKNIKIENMHQGLLKSKDQIEETKIENEKKPEPVIKIIDTITIEATANSWIEIQDNNSEILVSKIIKKDSQIKLPYKKDLILVTGNAGGIIIHIDNNVINNLGASGEVKRNISLNLENLIKFIDE